METQRPVVIYADQEYLYLTGIAILYKSLTSWIVDLDLSITFYVKVE